MQTSKSASPISSLASHQLKKRHLLMIALGSAIGTGLFFGSGQSIALTGPSILVSFIIGGIVMYIVVRALGEMAVFQPNVGSFSYYAYQYGGKYLGFIAGWNYWFNYIIVCMLELTATTMFLDFFAVSLPHWLMVLLLLLCFTIINLFRVTIFGEFEFWFTIIKVFTIVAMIAFGVYLIAFNAPIHASSVVNIKNILHDKGFFAGGIRGFILSFVVVIFSFGGTELIGISAGEASNPRKVVPLAINSIILRIIIFYVATLVIILCLYPWQKMATNISPFVDVFNKIGIKKAAIMMNIVAITAALSSFNSGLYGVARMLYNLAMQGNAINCFKLLNRYKSPSLAVVFSSACIFIAVLLNYFYPKQVFTLLLAIATTAAIINWLLILFTHILFRKKLATLSQSGSTYRLPLFPLTTIVAIVFFLVVIVAMLFMPNMKLAIYIAPIWLLLLSICYYLSGANKVQVNIN